MFQVLAQWHKKTLYQTAILSALMQFSTEHFLRMREKGKPAFLFNTQTGTQFASLCP